MCERNSCLLEAAIKYNPCDATEEHSSSGSNSNNCQYGNMNKKYISNSYANNIKATTNMELSFLPAVATTNTAVDDGTNSSSSSSSTNISTTSSTATSSAHCSSSSSSPAPQSSSSIGVNLRVTGQCSQGGRKYMEDYFSVAYQQSENAKDLEYAFVGIYDGHGGAEAATFAKEHLMMEIINQKLFWSDEDQDVLRAIREGYIATHYAMWRDQEKWAKKVTGLPSTAGTTATIAFIRREKIYIGHVGDSGIVLGYQNDNEKFWRAKQLTTDHKPESVTERNRIMRSGGKVVVKSGVPRVVWNRPRLAGHKGPIRRSTPVDEIPFLAVARSLGDLWSYNPAMNEFVVSPDPDVKVIKINPSTFRCLIFGTDGLWNVVSPQEAVDTVYEKEMINDRLQASRGESTAEGAEGQWTNPSKGLVKKALKTWASKKMRADNTSVVTVILYPPGTDIKDNALSCQTHSYGLEYTQVSAEIPTQDNVTTYAEMANKYLPPEEYRNFKYDDDDEICDEQKEAAAYAVYSALGYANYQPGVMSAAEHNYYDPPPPNYYDTTAHEEVVEATKSCVANNDEDNEEEDDEDEADFEDEDEADKADEDEIEVDEAMLQATKYNVLPVVSPVRLGSVFNAKAVEQHAAFDYMHSFAESYTDSLLGGNVSHNNLLLDDSNVSNTAASDSHCSDSTSSSSSSGSSSYHSTVYQHSEAQQQNLIMEHQQYQAQCMSQEEGYSLTKLETRGEQQMRSGNSTNANANAAPGVKEVQTFKIFQQHQHTNTLTADTLLASATAAGDASLGNTIVTTTATGRKLYFDARFPALCRFINSYEPNLELNSLLQQEMAEEQQVAMERLEMQRQAEAELQRMSPLQPLQSSKPLDEQTLWEEYLEDEIVALTHESTTVITTPLDETIQINEISSSIKSPPVSLAPPEIVDMEVDAVAVDEEAVAAAIALQSMKHDKIVRIEKIEILATTSNNSTKPVTAKPLPVSLTPSKLTKARRYSGLATRAPTQTPAHSRPLINPSPSKRTSSYFANVPNENQRHVMSLPCCSSTLRKSNSASPEKRQLRSTATPIVDYTKRTLRSRNSLSKDMKAKSTLQMRRSTAISTQYLRTTAATLLAANQERSAAASAPKHVVPHLTTASLPTHNTTKLVATAATTAHARTHNTSVPPTNAINLRSRQIAAVTTSAAVANTSTALHNSAIQRRERRNLRKLGGTQLPEGKEQHATPSSYSKATRMQSTAATSLAVPPPSPKLISAATRARSLLPNKTVVATTPYGKRSTLRSGALIVNTNSVAGSEALQTRSRVQKRLNR